MSTTRPVSATSPPMAGGLPLDEHIATQAADWLTLLMSGEMSEEDTQRWRTWRAAHPDHERAWRHIESVMGHIQVLESKAAYENLSPYRRAQAKSHKRRQLMSLLFLGGLAGSAGLAVERSDTWRQWAADHRSATGEQRQIRLEDGTNLVLNTDSAVDVAFNAEQRQIRLVAGEIFVETAYALSGSVDRRPLLVETAEGRIRALGTRFMVRQRDGETFVSVQESAVELHLASGDESPRILNAGQSMTFTRDRFEAATASQPAREAWLRGQIVAEDLRLGDFLGDLQRYRRGFIRCDPKVADLRFSGVFPLHDTDRILATLPSVLPVRVRQRTAYWVVVEPV